MAQYQSTSWPLSLSALCLLMVAAVLLIDEQAVFDKFLGLGLILPLSCLFIYIMGVLMGRAGVCIGAALAISWAIAVIIG